MLSRHQIHALLKEQGYTYKSVAAELGIRQASSVSDVVTGRQSSRRTAERICQIIGKTLTETFGTRYQAKPRRDYRTSPSLPQPTQESHHA